MCEHNLKIVQITTANKLFIFLHQQEIVTTDKNMSLATNIKQLSKYIYHLLNKLTE